MQWSCDPVWLRRQRPELLRQLLQRAGIRLFLAAVLREYGVGSIRRRGVDVVSRVWLRLRFCVPMGLDALPLWFVDVCAGLRLGLAAGRLEQLAAGTRGQQCSATIRAATASDCAGAWDSLGRQRASGTGGRSTATHYGDPGFGRLRNPARSRGRSFQGFAAGDAKGIHDDSQQLGIPVSDGATEQFWFFQCADARRDEFS